MHKKFEINRTKIKGCCQSGRKVVTKIHNSKSDLPLVLLVLPINVKKPIITIQGVLGGHMVVFMDENVIIHTNMTTNAVSNHKKWDSGLLLLKHLNRSSDLDSPQCVVRERETEFYESLRVWDEITKWTQTEPTNVKCSNKSNSSWLGEDVLSAVGWVSQPIHGGGKWHPLARYTIGIDPACQIVL